MNKEILIHDDKAPKFNQTNETNISTIDDLRGIQLYYEKEKEKFKIRLETKLLAEQDKLTIYKKLSLYSLKTILIVYCLNNPNTH